LILIIEATSIETQHVSQEEPGLNDSSQEERSQGNTIEKNITMIPFSSFARNPYSYSESGGSPSIFV